MRKIFRASKNSMILMLEIFFKHYVCVCVFEWAQLCLILYNPRDCSLPGSSIPGLLQARILDCVAISSSRGSSQSRGGTHVSCISCIGRQILYHLSHLGSPNTTYSIALSFSIIKYYIFNNFHLTLNTAYSIALSFNIIKYCIFNNITW